MAHLSPSDMSDLFAKFLEEKFGQPQTQQSRREPEEELLPSGSQTMVVASTSKSGTEFEDMEDINTPEFHGPDKGDERRRKKKNFTEEEKKILVEKVVSSYEALFGKNADRIPLAHKNKIWGNIATQINSLGVDRRSISELKKKWHDCRRLCKVKLAKIHQMVKQTGGGPCTTSPLSEIEELIASTYRKEQISGIGNMDTMELEFHDDGQVQDDCAEDSELCPALSPSNAEIDDSGNVQEAPNVPETNVDMDSRNVLQSYMTATQKFFNDLIETQRDIALSLRNIRSDFKDAFQGIYTEVCRMSNHLCSQSMRSPENPIPECSSPSNSSVSDVALLLDEPLNLSVSVESMSRESIPSNPPKPDFQLSVGPTKVGKDRVGGSKRNISPQATSGSAHFLMHVKSELSKSPECVGKKRFKKK